jgi:hypothetical protein
LAQAVSPHDGRLGALTILHKQAMREWLANRLTYSNQVTAA